VHSAEVIISNGSLSPKNIDLIVHCSQCSFQCLLNLPSSSKLLRAGNAWNEFPATERLMVDQMLMLSSPQCIAVKEDVSRG